jgi:hypothetical protein
MRHAGGRSVCGLTGLVAVAAWTFGCGAASESAGGSAGTGRFSQSTTIDNEWLPLRPGVKLVLTGTTSDGPHREVVIVTDLVKVIDGVRTVVVWDRDYEGSRLAEGELAFVAQDDAGNVWNYGEYPEEYDDGKLTGAPKTWIAGVAGASAGIAMQADSRPGGAEYLQGSAPTIGFADTAQVKAVKPTLCVPVGCYRDVLQTEEGSPDQPSAHQLKYYASGVGPVRVGFAGRGDREALTLVQREEMDAVALALAREEAARIDRRGYTVSRELYGHTAPAVAP